MDTDTAKTETSAIETESASEMQLLLKRLETMETLLKEQAEREKKSSKNRNIVSLLLLCLVLVFAVGLFSLNKTVATATQDLPALVQTTTKSMQDMQVAMENVNSMDFEALNKSIKNLETVSEQLAKVMQFFR